MKKCIAILTLTLILGTLLANNVDKNAGEKGFLFLRIPVSPELAAMANTGEMHHSSPITMLHHPAAFDWQRGKALAFSQSMWFVDTYLYNIAYRNVMFDRAWGLAIKYMDYGQIDKREDNGTLIGSYYPMDLQLGANYVYRITPDIQAGATINLLYEKIDTASALGFTADIGAVYRTPLQNTSIDFALKNIGTTNKMDEKKIELPTTAEIGLSTGYEIEEGYAIYPAAKLVYMNDHEDLLPAVGANIKLFEMLFVRAGYKFNYHDEDFSAGIGIHYNNFTVDYGFINNQEFDPVHKFGVTYKF